MYFRVYCNVKEIEAPDIGTAEQILRDSLKEVIWLIPVTETPVAPPAREPGRPIKVKEKRRTRFNDRTPLESAVEARDVLTSCTARHQAAKRPGEVRK